MRKIKFRAWNNYQDEMISWSELHEEHYNCMDNFSDGVLEFMQFTGLYGKNSVEIFEGDITELLVSGIDKRRFVVSIENVVREVVNHSDFAGPASKVEIMGVVFKWEGYELFPMLDDSGRSDVSRMRVIGNIYENPELIKGSD